jgi:hypothetical protein
VQLALDLGVFCSRCSIGEGLSDDQFDVIVGRVLSGGSRRDHGSVVLGLSSNGLEVCGRGRCDSPRSVMVRGCSVISQLTGSSAAVVAHG